jgi:hypothetical protein
VGLWWCKSVGCGWCAGVVGVGVWGCGVCGGMGMGGGGGVAV